MSHVAAMYMQVQKQATFTYGASSYMFFLAFAFASHCEPGYRKLGLSLKPGNLDGVNQVNVKTNNASWQPKQTSLASEYFQVLFRFLPC